jgi:hypothetical protein
MGLTKSFERYGATSHPLLGCARVVVRAGLRLVAERVYGRPMAGTCG